MLYNSQITDRVRFPVFHLFPCSFLTLSLVWSVEYESHPGTWHAHLTLASPSSSPPVMVRIVGRASIGLILLLSLSLCLSSVSLSAVAEENSYADGENIVLWANKVGPYHK